MGNKIKTTGRSCVLLAAILMIGCANRDHVASKNPYPNAPIKRQEVRKKGVNVTVYDMDAERSVGGYTAQLLWVREDNKSILGNATAPLRVESNMGEEGATFHLLEGSEYVGIPLEFKIRLTGFDDPTLGNFWESKIHPIPPIHTKYQIDITAKEEAGTYP